jgi:hypothetical protein
MTKPRTILVTFAGRRDRMELLTRYAGAAIERGLIDEWHVWQFARNAEDQRWLRERFPVVQATPNAAVEYFRLPRPMSLRTAQERIAFRVRAANDAHIALKRLSGEGPSFEIVLGGWGNQVCVIRKFDDPAAIENPALRDSGKPADIAVAAPGLLPEFGFSDVAVQVGQEGLLVLFNGAPLLHDPEPVTGGAFEILYGTGYGSNGDWRFDQFDEHPARLFVTGPDSHFPATAPFYNRAYQYYAANAEAYQDDVILKCDDDIVYFDLDKLAEFIVFRRHNPHYFLVSANVVNNGVCAHFQQAMGAIPPQMMVCELPPGGMCGALWSEGARADALHRLFLMAPESFLREEAAPIVWNERISINFIALLGSDLVHIPDVSADDEHDLCYGVRKRARKQNCIYPQFIAAHLSFWKQEASMNIAAAIAGYAALADRRRETPSQPVIAAE